MLRVVWPFSNKLSSPSAQKQLKEFAESLDNLERRVKSVELEWEAAYDKLHAQLGRIARRAQKLHDEAENNGKLAPLDESETQIDPIPVDPEVGTPVTLSRLTARQRHIQAQVMARRARLRS